MKRYSKNDVELYSERYDRPLPSITVKVYRFGHGLDNEKLKCSESTFENAMQYAFESTQQNFWESVQETAEYYLGKGIKVYSAGRSGGHLTVDGLDPVESWNAISLTRWRRFEKAVLDEVKYLSSDEQVQESIECNRWNLDGAELYNFYEKKDGGCVCIAELKAQAVKAGFGPIVRA